MKVILDKNFHIEPDSFNGVILTKTEQKTIKNKEGKDVEKTFVYKNYYPNPVQAIQEWIKQTGTEDVDIHGLKNVWIDINKKLGDIYHKFGEVNWFSKEV